MSAVTQRTRLELAALAAGLDYNWNDDFGLFNKKTEQYWNPYVSDADAFTLGVTLGIMCEEQIRLSDNSRFIKTLTPFEVHVYHNGDKITATRHAIMEVAYRIGVELQATQNLNP